MIEGLRVLVVEDEFLVAALLCDMIEDAGGTPVGPARSVPEALALVEGSGFDVAVLDWNLDGDSGEKVAAVLAERGTPFVISTGYGAVSGQFGDRPILDKPYPATALVEHLLRLRK